MALRAQVSFKKEEFELYTFLKGKSEIIGDSGYMKTLLKKEKDKEESKNKK